MENDSKEKDDIKNKRKIQNRDEDTSIEGQFQDRGRSHEKDEEQ